MKQIPKIKFTKRKRADGGKIITITNWKEIYDIIGIYAFRDFLGVYYALWTQAFGKVSYDHVMNSEIGGMIKSPEMTHTQSIMRQATLDAFMQNRVGGVPSMDETLKHIIEMNNILGVPNKKYEEVINNYQG